MEHEPNKQKQALIIPVIDAAYYETAKALINNAKTEILFSTFKLESRAHKSAEKVNLLLADLIAVSQNIQTTKVLLTKLCPGCSLTLLHQEPVNTLKQYNIDVRHIPDARTVHAKLLIVDEKQLLIGSHNWSIHSLSVNYEVSLLITHPETIQHVRASFLSNFDRARAW